MSSPESLERAREWLLAEEICREYREHSVLVNSLAALLDSVRAGERAYILASEQVSPQFIEEVRARERERCAKIAEATKLPTLTGHRNDSPMESQSKGFYIAVRGIAAAIRAAGETR